MSFQKLLLAVFLFILVGCGPSLHTAITDTSFKPLDAKMDVAVLDVSQSPPDGCKMIGTLKIGDNGLSIDCGYVKVITLAKDIARKAGGNIIKITELIPPGVSSCYRIKADILYRENTKDSTAKTNFVRRNGPDTIQIPTVHGEAFRQRGKDITLTEVWNITGMNSTAWKEVKIAKTNSVVAYFFGYTGGFLIGYQLAGLLFEKKTNFYAAGLGATCIGISIPFSIGIKKHTKRAVELYNKSLK